MEKKAKEIKVLYIIGNGFRPEEYFYSKEVIEEAGFVIVTAGKQKKVPARIIPGQKNFADADITFDEVDLEEERYNAIVVPGGSPGWENLYKDAVVMKILKDAKEKNLLIASICASPAVLSKAGVLEGKKATIYPGMADYLKRGKCIPINSDESFENKTVIVRDENLITSNGPWASREFGKAIVEELNKKFEN